MPNLEKQEARRVKGLNRGNSWGKPWGVEAQMRKDREERGGYIARKMRLIRKEKRQAAVRALIRARKQETVQ